MVKELTCSLVTFAVLSLLMLSGCYFEGGTPDAIRSHNDGIVGLSKTAKETSDAPNQYFDARKVQDTQPSFWQKLTQGS